jgi:DNA-binding response OmpR family regulator
MRILLVEDEMQLANALAAILKQHKYLVDLSADGEDAIYRALSGIYDLIVLDIMLPKKDGLAVLREIRSAGLATPVILLTARTTTTDKVDGLDAGADDYLPKPFEAEELLARIRALSRRNPQSIHDNILQFADLSFDPRSSLLSCGDGSFSLTKKEGQLLEQLMRAQGRILPKELLIDKIWGFEGEAIGSNVEVYVSFLRKKMKQLESQAKIKAVRGLGYRLEATNTTAVTTATTNILSKSARKRSVD